MRRLDYRMILALAVHTYEQAIGVASCTQERAIALLKFFDNVAKIGPWGENGLVMQFTNLPEHAPQTAQFMIMLRPPLVLDKSYFMIMPHRWGVWLFHTPGCSSFVSYANAGAAIAAWAILNEEEGELPDPTELLLEYEHMAADVTAEASMATLYKQVAEHVRDEYAPGAFVAEHIGIEIMRDLYEHLPLPPGVCRGIIVRFRSGKILILLVAAKLIIFDAERMSELYDEQPSFVEHMAAPSTIAQIILSMASTV